MAAANKSKAFTAILFVTCAVPGVFMFLFASIALIAYALDPKDGKIPNPFLLLLAIVVGSCMLLFGLQIHHRWRYLFVFWSIPIALLLFSPTGNLVVLGLAAGIIAFFVFQYVRRYYEKRETR